MDITNSSVVNIENATVEFKKGTIGTITTYQFDTSKGGHPMVNAMAGLGFLFSSKSLKAKVARPFFMVFFKFLLNSSGGRVILQNTDDVSVLSNSGVLDEKRIALIRGSGVDTLEYAAKPELDSEPVVILASRLLWDKGVGEFVDAARILKEQGISARFALLGEGDVENPGSISDEQLQSWHDEVVIERWGKKNNMPEVFAQIHIVCLPSFYPFDLLPK